MMCNINREGQRKFFSCSTCLRAGMGQVYLFLVAILLAVRLVPGLKSVSPESCPDACAFQRDKQMAHCVGLNMKCFPDLPEFVKTLVLTECHGDFSPENLQPLYRQNKVKNFELLDNNFSNVKPEPLKGLMNLSVLIINEASWTKEMLANCLQGLRYTYVEALTIGRILELEQLENLFIQHLEGTGISSLTLTRLPKFSNFTGTMLHNVTLRYLYLIECPLKKIDLNGLGQLTSLTLRQLNLRNLPQLNFCDFNLSSLEYLHSHDNIQTLFPEEFDCLDNLTKLELLNHLFHHIGKNFVARLPKLNFLRITRTGTVLPHVDALAFNSTSLKRLTFEGSDFTFKITNYSVPSNIFQYCSQLEYLSFSHFDMTNCDVSYIRELFKPLSKLREFYFEFIDTPEVPNRFLSFAPNLTLLSLFATESSIWINHDIFWNIRNLTTLFMGYCNLAVINKTVIPDHVLATVQNLSLIGNHFECDCEILEFMKWFEKNKEKIWRLDDRRYFCNSPASKQGLLLKDFYISELECFDFSHVIYAASFGIIVFLVGVVILKYWYYLRYVFFVLRHGGDDPQRIRHFEYDAFLIYSFVDQNWVTAEFLPEMETKRGFKFCVPSRNFELARLEYDNLVESMHRSRKIVLILTRSFFKCKHCKMAMRLAKKRSCIEERNIFVFVVFESVKFTNIDNKFIYTMLHTHTYAEYQDIAADEEDSRVFWKQLNQSLSTDSSNITESQNGIANGHESTSLNPL